MVDLDALGLAQSLLRCPSVDAGGGRSPRVHRDCVATKRVSRSTVRVFSAARTPDVENLYARVGSGQPYLLFAGHTDVVPPGDAERWRHGPFAGVIDGGELYGRGAVDMKGGIACMMAAALRFIADRPDFGGSLGFLITGDEEGPAINGTVKLLDWARARGERFDHCILGEPTNPNRLGDMIKIGRRGSLTGTIVVEGKQGHVAYPHLAQNPIPLDDAAAGSPAAAKRSTREQSTSTPRTSRVTTFDVGNPAANVIAAQARATFNVRFNDTGRPRACRAKSTGAYGRQPATTFAIK